MSMAGHGSNSNKFEPIYIVMKNRGLIDKLMFTLCLGTNGGYFQIGGFDGTGFIEAEPTWVPMVSRNSDFFVTLKGMMINNHEMKGFP
jgi:hypothetical protein